MSRKDPIIEEIHAIREKLAREANYDMEKLFAAARVRQVASGVDAVQLPPRQPLAAKKAS
jgi:hypothetical protein